MRSRVVQSFLVAAALTFVGAAPAALADDIEDQKAYVAQIADQLEALENRIGELDEEYGAARDRIDVLEAEIAVSQAEVDAQQAELAELQGQLGVIAVARFTSGGSGGLTPLFATPQSYTEDLQRGELPRVALDQGAGDTDEMAALVEDLAEATAVLEDQKTEQAALLESLDAKRAVGEELTQQYEQEYADAKALLGDLIVEEQERRVAQAIAEAQERERQRQAEIAAANARAAAPARGGGAAPAPVRQFASGGGNSNTDSNSTSGGGGGGGNGGATSTPAPESNDAPIVAAPSAPAPQAPAPAPQVPAPAPAPEPAPNVPAPASTAGIAVNAASGQLGVPYRFAAEEPGVAFDCSGLTKYAWGRAGVYLPHQSSAQYGSTPHVPKESVQPGDLIFYYAPIGHVAIYIGGGSMIHAPQTGDVVKVSAVRWEKVVGVSRPG